MELIRSSLLKLIREERDLILDLNSLGLTTKQAFELISDPIIGEAQTDDDPGEGFVDASDRFEEGGVITWWNDIEKDKRWVFELVIHNKLRSIPRYNQWPKSIQSVSCPDFDLDSADPFSISDLCTPVSFTPSEEILGTWFLSLIYL